MFKFYRIVKQLVFVSSITFCLNGCGTMTAIKDGGVVGMGDWNKEPEKIIVYQGLMTDAGRILQYGEWYRMIDFPLSFVADTVLLPYTIPSAFAEQNTHKAE